MLHGWMKCPTTATVGCCDIGSHVQVITMHEKYMPKELFSDKEQKKSLRARKLKTKAAKQGARVHTGYQHFEEPW